MQRKTAVHIDLDAIRANFALACSLAPDAQAVAVIKADAYGHGIVPVAMALCDSVSMFAVATVDEAVILREAGIKNAVLVLEGASTTGGVAVARSLDLVLMVHSQDQVAMLANTHAATWVKVDTGMHRLGIAPADLGGMLEQLRVGDVDVHVVCTHLACADDIENNATHEQLEVFRSCTVGSDLPQSIANSAGIIAWPDSHVDWIRPGIMLYGVSPFMADLESAGRLQPAMTFSSEVIAIRKVPAGHSVGYGARWTADRPSVIATIAAGYADGYPRHAPNGTPVFVGGRVVPLVGTVSMDMITVDVTDYDGVAIGDTVELWGRSISVNDVAERAETISYELLTGVTSRVPRSYA